MQHISDDLPRLLTGDATREVVLEAAQHLRVCVDCQQELVSAVIAHASLTSAHRFAPEIVAPDSTDLDDLDGLEHADAELAPVVPLPDLSHVFAEVRAEAAPAAAASTGSTGSLGEHRARRDHRLRRRLVAVAAAAAVVTGGGVTYAAVHGNNGPVSRTVALQPFDRGNQPAQVTIVGNSTLRVDASRLPKLGKDRIYEVWLTDSQRQNMQPVGSIGDDNKAELSVSPKWMSQYNDIEVSVQQVGQDKFSGISVLRGPYSSD